MLFAGCVELFLFLEGPVLHMLGCVELCLFLEGPVLYMLGCVDLASFLRGQACFGVSASSHCPCLGG